MKLKTGQDTPAMGRRVVKAAREALGRRRLSADFEHGQWWVSCLQTGAAWSVVDVVGHSAIDGFGFELVSQGYED